MAEAAMSGRPKTLEEAKEFLRERLATRRSPMNEVDEAEAARAIDRLEGLDGERWASVWGAVGQKFERAAREAEARSDAKAAAAGYFQAYAFSFIGRYPSPNHPKKRECYLKARENHLKAGRYFDPPLQGIAIPFVGRPGEGSEVVIYVRKPKGVSRPPVVMRWGGIDTWKEERSDLNDRFLHDGFASITIDMPGVGESPVLGSPDAERQYTPVFEWIRAQNDLDGSRIGIIGMSFGGYWAAKLAHTHRQYLRAAVCWGGGIHSNFQPEWAARSRYADSYLMDLAETRAQMMGLTSYDEYVQRVPALSLLDQGILDQPCAPLLLVNGKDDRQVPIEDRYLVLQHGSPKSARIFPGGHMGHTPETFPTIMRWLGKRLRS